MARNLAFVAALAFFSLLTGYLLSAISFTGKAGISIFYTEYNFLKFWWKGALLVFIVWIALFAALSSIKRRVNKPTFHITVTVSSLIATAGIFFSYTDFRNSLSHRWLGERFHLGVYLFWLGCIAISLFLLSNKKSFATDVQKESKESADPL